MMYNVYREVKVAYWTVVEADSSTEAEQKVIDVPLEDMNCSGVVNSDICAYKMEDQDDQI